MQSTAPQEDSLSEEAYSACINTAQGSPEKIEACQSVLNVLKKEKQHQQFADQEKVYAYWIISSVCVQRKPEMIRR